jgi:hypothetical protein
MGNNLIQLAITQNGDTYSFNPVGQNFNNYCELSKYYEDQQSLACVRPVYTNDAAKVISTVSLLQILGISLLFKSLSSIKPIIIQSFVMTIMQSLNSNQHKLFVSSASGGCIPNSYVGGSFFKINDLTLLELDSILSLFKQFMFYFKFVMFPAQFLDRLTFDKILKEDQSEAAVHVLDKDGFKTKIQTESFNLYKKFFYTKDYLEKTKAGAFGVPAAPAAPSAPSVVAPSVVAPSVVAASVVAASASASVMEIVAKLQEDVDAIKAKLGM